jgi:hypothetical protein
MPFDPSDEIQALCTFTPTGGDPEDAVALGVDDCWVEVQVEPGREIYIVHSQYVSRDGSPFYIEGTARAEAETYLLDIVTALGGFVRMTQISDSNGNPLYVPQDGAVDGTLANPFTSLSVANLFLVSAESQDEGGRSYGIDFRFEKSVPVGGGGTPGTADFTWGSVQIGNQPGTMHTVPDEAFVRTVCTTKYVGSDAGTYADTLAESLNLSTLSLIVLPRGTSGARGVIKSATATKNTLTWVSRSDSFVDVYPESVSGEIDDNGMLSLTVTFIKER